MRRPTLGLAIFTDRVGHLAESVPALRPHVDATACLVDASAWSDGLAAELTALGLKPLSFSWQCNFSLAFNAAAALCACDWIFQLDSDETLSDPALVRSIVDEADVAVGSERVRIVLTPRRHWIRDQATGELVEDRRWWPDYQARIRRAEVLLCYRAHPIPEDYAGEIINDQLIIEHYNLLRDAASWARAEALYSAQLAADARLEGRVFPGR